MQRIVLAFVLALLSGPASASAPLPAQAPDAPPAPVREVAPPPADAIAEPPPAATPGPRRTLTITLGGDLGLNPDGAPVEAAGTRRHGRYLAWEELTRGIRPLLDGDLNFANLETVVTARNDLPPQDKAFVFRSHPAGVAHLAALGFNLISTANNHAIDYGLSGLRETMDHLDRLEAEGRIMAHAGVGLHREAAGRPRLVGIRGARVGFAALGIASGGRAGDDRPGIMAWRSPEDVAEVIQRLADAPADYRILSVHHGQERDVTTDQDAIRKLRHQAVLGGGIDLVVGHHAHVVQGIERTGDGLILYGLGNLLHPGMQDMGVFGICQDYGLMVRVHLAGPEAGRLALKAIEAIPLTDMHWQARPMSPAEGRERIVVLNHLASLLDHAASGARGLRFAPRPDGTGLACEPGAAAEPGRIGALCADWQGVPEPSPALAARVRSACAAGPRIAASRGSATTTSARRSPAPASVRTAAPDGRWIGGVFNGN